jgi:hypothetical protein
MTENTSLSQCIGEYVTNGVQALKSEIMEELKVHGKAALTFRVKYRQLDSGMIDVELERRLAHSASVVKTAIGQLNQQQLPGM